MNPPAADSEDSVDIAVGIVVVVAVVVVVAALDYED